MWKLRIQFCKIVPGVSQTYDLPLVRVVNGTWKVQGLGRFCSNLEISEAFSVSLEILFSCQNLVFLCVPDSQIFGCEVSDFVFLANGFDQNHGKIVYLIKRTAQ